MCDPMETSAEVKAAAEFLAGYCGRRERPTRSPSVVFRWCDRHRLQLFEVTRTHIELYPLQSRSGILNAAQYAVPEMADARRVWNQSPSSNQA